MIIMRLEDERILEDDRLELKRETIGLPIQVKIQPGLHD
jgi:hypothetical protein